MKIAKKPSKIGKKRGIFELFLSQSWPGFGSLALEYLTECAHRNIEMPTNGQGQWRQMHVKCHPVSYEILDICSP
jgi:hypothetical protein